MCSIATDAPVLSFLRNVQLHPHNISAKTLVYTCYWGMFHCQLAWKNAIVMVRVVRPSVTCESPKLRETDTRLLENSNKNPGLLIQKLLSDTQSEIWFRHFGCFHFTHSRHSTGTAVGLMNGSVRTVTSLDTRLALLVSSCISSYAQLHWRKRSAILRPSVHHIEYLRN